MTRTSISVNDLECLTNEDLLQKEYTGFDWMAEEPYDPELLSDKGYEIPDLSGYEKRFNRKISIIENKLKKNHIRYEWLSNYEMFRVGKKRQDSRGNVSNYYTYQYIAVYMETNEYAFGGWEEDRCVSTRISDVIESVKEWMYNNEPGLK